jgi:hypothetical protein
LLMRIISISITGSVMWMKYLSRNFLKYDLLLYDSLFSFAVPFELIPSHLFLIYYIYFIFSILDIYNSTNTLYAVNEDFKYIMDRNVFIRFLPIIYLKSSLI